MDNQNNTVAALVQMIEAADKNINTAKAMLRDMLNDSDINTSNAARAAVNALSLHTLPDGGKVIEGHFDGQNMLGPDQKSYPVPVNYASKSKLVAGDTLKLTIANDGSFIYKQIQPIDRKKMMGLLVQDDKGEFKVIAGDKTFKVLYAALTYFKAQVGDTVTIIVPEKQDSVWAAVENVIHSHHAVDSGDAAEMEMSHVPDPVRTPSLELDTEF